MIKLIAVDLDGTLLDDNKNIHPSFWEVHKTLTERGVIFIAASGRQYYNLLEQFDRIRDEIIFLAENGTFVVYKGHELFVNDLSFDDARYFIRKGRNIKGADLILCGKQSAWVENNFEPFIEDASRYYRRLKLVDDLTTVDDKVLKVTLWDHENAEFNSYPHFKEYEKDFKIAVAGDVWLDITHNNASKGNAIKRIQQLFGITPEETLIFGDYLNDLDMMQVGYHSYAMKNAHPKIIEASRFVTRYDNNNNGVVETIKELFNLNS
ncbi:MAG: Cof-type HAD-IIB family hydrolase [Bacteroidales bacterium]|nr:Cof-type HAD-IIB family hydrolase [Bacteroidales bacterium]